MSAPRLVAACVAAAALAGCATWTRIENPLQTAADESFSIEAPVGWVRLTRDRNRVLITRDGPPIQFIAVALQPHDKAFEKIKKKSAADLLPAELAELTVAELKTEPPLQNIQVLASEPRSVAGRPGFALHLQYRSERGALFDREVYGVALKENMLYFTYNALHLYYFERDGKVFEEVVASYKPLAPAAAP